ncbi:MAG: VOC family protein [bacterium]
MKIRAMYFKVNDMEAELAFWQKLFGRTFEKKTETYFECKIDDTRIALMQGEDGDSYSGSGAVPVFEYNEIELGHYADKAISLGATLVLDGMRDPNIQGMVLRDPEGHEFELTRLHG